MTLSTMSTQCLPKLFFMIIWWLFEQPGQFPTESDQYLHESFT